MKLGLRFITVIMSCALITIGCSGSGGGSGSSVDVSGVSFTETSTYLHMGESKQLTATIMPTNADDTSVTWASNDTGVVTVSDSGLISAVAAGNAKVTVTTVDGSFTAICDVRVKTWTHPSGLNDFISPAGESGGSQKVAMSKNGDIVIAWKQSNGTNSMIFMSHYTNGQWTHPLTLSDHISQGGQGAGNIDVAIDDFGNAIITWQQQDDSSVYRIFKSEYRNGVWTHPSSLTDNISQGGQSAHYPKVAMGSNGDAIIAWYQSNGTNDQVFKSEYRNGSWDHPDNLDDNISPDSGSAGNVNVAMDNTGNAIVVWRDFDGSNFQILMSEYRNNSWDHPDNVDDNYSPDGSHAVSPVVAMDNNGNAIIVWRQHDGSDYLLLKSEYRNGSWTHPGSIADSFNPTGTEVWDCQVAMDDNSNIIIIWKQDDPSLTDLLFKSEYRNGSWAHPNGITDNLSSAYGSDIYAPTVDMDGNGNAIITWSQSDGTNDYIFKSEYRNGSWIHPIDSSDYISFSGYSAGLPLACLDNLGNAIIVWAQYIDGTYYHIFKSEYR